MIWNRVARYVAIATIFGFSVLVLVDKAHSGALTDLNNAFKEAYSLASAQTLSNLRGSVPVLVNRFGEIALYRPGTEQPDLFKMDMKLYLETRAVAHTAAALYARLAPFGLGDLDSERLEWLAKYQSLLLAAEDEVKSQAGGYIPIDLAVVQIRMLEAVRGFAQRIHQQEAVDQAVLDELGEAVRAAVRTNLEFAAASQLEQFRKQINQWKEENSSLAWDDAVVVIIGIHQARDRYLQRQFFDWMLHDQPIIQARVVYAETMTPPPLQPATDALTLLSKVMLDKGLSSSVFGDPLALQSDVLGDAAEAIIREWPPF